MPNAASSTPTSRSPFWTCSIARAETPLTVTVNNPVDGTPLTLHLSDAELTAGLFNAFYDAETHSGAAVRDRSPR